MANRTVQVKITAEDQASKVFKNVAGSIDMMGHALEAAGIAEAIAKIAEWTHKGIDAAEAMNKLSQKTGISTETLSGYVHAAKLADVGTEGLEKSLKFLAKNMADAAGGGKETQAAFRAIGVAVTDANGKLRPMDQVMNDLADRFQKAKDGPEKAALAMKVFGKSGADMIPLLNQGSAGLKQMSDEAKKLGVYMSEDDAAAAEEFNDKIKSLEEESTGLAMSFAKGLMPQLTSLVDMLLGPGPEAFSATQKAGELLGKGIKLLVLGFYALAIGIDYLAHKTSLFFEALSKAQTGDISGAIESFKTLAGVTQDVAAEYLKAQLAIKQGELFPDEDEQRANAALAKAKLNAKRRAEVSKNAMDVVQNDAVDHAKARADLEQAQAQHLANILKRATDVRMAMLDAEYSRGEVSTVAYYQRRQKLVEDGLNGEIAALQKAVTAYEQLAEAQTGSDRDKTLKKAEEAQDKLEAKQAELRKAQIDGAEQERQARKQVTDALLQYEAEYRAAKGETAATTLQQIEQEFQARRKMMQAEGQDTSHLDELERIQKAKAMAAQVEEQINQIYDRIATDERVILDQVARGQITRLEGEKQINALHAQNADAIQVLIDKYKEYADASGDPRLVENARRQGVALDELKTKANELAQDLRNGLTNSFEQLFTDMMTGTKSAGEAFKDFGRSIIAMIAQMIAKMIAMYIVGKLLGWFMGGISGGGGGSDSGLSDAFSGGADVGYAAAGDQLSPGQATIIGEDGPELLIPRATSTVLSNRELNKLNGGGGNVFQFNVDARGADAGVEARVYRAMRFTKDQAVREAVATVEDRQRRR